MPARKPQAPAPERDQAHTDVTETGQLHNIWRRCITMFESNNGCSWLSRAARHFHTDRLVSRKPWEASLSYLQCSFISQLLPARYHYVVSVTRSQHKRLNKINKVIHDQFSHAREKEKKKRLFPTSSCTRDKINKVIQSQPVHAREVKWIRLFTTSSSHAGEIK